MIRVTLQRTLDELGITRNKLAVDYKIRPATLHALVNGETTQIKFETIDTILNALNDMAKVIGVDKIYTITDIIDYEYVKGE